MTLENQLLLVAGPLGLLLGFFFYEGLWQTVRRLPRAANPHLIILASFLIRMAVAVIGFYLISKGDWAAVAVCLIGFLISRHILLRIRGPVKGG